MSDTPSAAPARPERPEGLFGALIGFIALALVFGLVIATLGLRLRDSDVSALYAEVVPDAETPLPLGLTYSGGTAMAGDQRSLVFDRSVPDGTVDAEPSWPRKAAIVRFSDPQMARRLFSPMPNNLPRDLSKDLERWSKEPYRFEAVTRRGTLTFGTHETDFVVLRMFQKDGTFFDIVRVDLTAGSVGQYLEAHWASGFEDAEATSLVPLLERFALPASEPAPAPPAGE